MRLYLGYLMLCLYLAGTTPILELGRVPFLFEHFNHHKEQNGGLSMKGFLFIHYASDNDSGADDNQDKQLPFNNPHFSLAHDMVFLPGLALSIKPVSIHIIEHNTPYFFVFQSYMGSVWHPPALV